MRRENVSEEVVAESVERIGGDRLEQKKVSKDKTERERD